MSAETRSDKKVQVTITIKVCCRNTAPGNSQIRNLLSRSSSQISTSVIEIEAISQGGTARFMFIPTAGDIQIKVFVHVKEDGSQIFINKTVEKA